MRTWMRCEVREWAVGWTGSAGALQQTADRQSDGRRSAADKQQCGRQQHTRLTYDNTQQQSQQCDAITTLQRGRRLSDPNKTKQKREKEKRKHFPAELAKTRTSNSFNRLKKSV